MNTTGAGELYPILGMAVITIITLCIVYFICDKKLKDAEKNDEK